MREATLLDLVSTAVLLVDHEGRVARLNTAAEGLMGISAQQAAGQLLSHFLADGPDRASLQALLGPAWAQELSVRRLQVRLRCAGRGPILLDATVMTLEEPGLLASIELREPDAFLRIDREERQAALLAANQSLLRNLGHEIKNPLGGIRGAAQLLDSELPTRALKEYTQVIMKESDRLTGLVDRMLAPVKRAGEQHPVNIHEVLERVRRLVLSEFPAHLNIRRDYDLSLPEVQGDREQLIQMTLNIVRNAAQALMLAFTERGEEGVITLRSRVARQVTLSRKRHRLALRLTIEDNGPGIPEAIQDQIFYPLVSGRPDGHGLGLTIAQSIVKQHGGSIACDSSASGCAFEILLPLQEGAWS
ncbi:MAG: PAS domain-containing sensor histidine kinase [Betaproteobacteria bacterium]|nr:PAS domain-containing sensor histidine kinase [Betaproteobacteria bacterium]NBT75451.1 PAS domain-containing sensor histidine kinase [Betaproteobacteria bacterium]NBY13966.1 PAS domain-containing sensor histidine kinase [Betaproteobacteria bacterium]NCA16534.1 PAS domain-containing sensor histidine kinase [Betaproteobacteria bacterium]NDF03847.1 PAS domain-containing sensor histidine kinase [Betaproteobacteria bacterium]